VSNGTLEIPDIYKKFPVTPPRDFDVLESQILGFMTEEFATKPRFASHARRPNSNSWGGACNGRMGRLPAKVGKIRAFRGLLPDAGCYSAFGIPIMAQPRHQVDSRPEAARKSQRAKFALNRELVISAGLRLLPILDRLLMRYAATDEYQIFPNELFPWTSNLAQNWSVIRDEAKDLLHNPLSIPSVRELSADQEKIAVDDRWRSFFFWGYGLRAERNCARCPATARILEQIPDLLSALYSVTLAGAHIPRHTGPTKAILTLHMGLIIPRNREDCRMQVGDHNVIWREGRVLIFDDMYPHEVWNDTNEDRVILMLHLKRLLRFPGSLLRDMLFAALRTSPFVRDGLRNLDRWEKSQFSPKAPIIKT
jgi:beta-hydroxylase